METRHDMQVYGASGEEEPATQYISVSFPGLGEVTITYETSPWLGEDAKPVFQFNFDPRDKIRIINHRGNDINLEGR